MASKRGKLGNGSNKCTTKEEEQENSKEEHDHFMRVIEAFKCYRYACFLNY